MDMTEHRKSFFEQGFVTVPSLLTAARVDAIKSDIFDILRAAFAGIGEKPESTSLDELYLELKHRFPVQKGRAYDLMGKVMTMHSAFCTPELQNLCQEILGGPAVVDQLQVRIDDKSNDRILPMHQEVAQMSLKNVTVWIPLQDVRSDEDGGLRVIPGSHSSGFLPHRRFEEPQAYYGVREEYLDPEDELRVQMKMGDALLFHPLLIHGSVPNTLDRVRWTAVGRINGLASMKYLEDGTLRYPVNRDQPDYQKYNDGFFWK